ncbi:MAG: hypothetical protein U0234_16700 [Sandaracinus sp.]
MESASESAALGTRLARQLVTGASLLTLASGAHKAAMFVMRARVGQLGGAQALGAVTSVLTLTWMISALSHLGLPDHALVRAALPDADAVARGRARHTLFLFSAGLALVLSLGLALPRASDAGLAALLVIGAIAQHASSVTLQTLRGAGRPGLESISLAIAATLLAAGAWLASDSRSVAASYVVSGLVFVGALALGMRTVPALRPAWPRAQAALDEVRRSLPLFVVGVTAFGLGSSDVMVSSYVLGDAAVGRLTCATMVVRTGFQVPWILGTLALARIHEAGADRARLIRALALVAALLGVAAGGTAVLTGELASRAFGVPLAEMDRALVVSAGLAPIVYVAVVLLPLGMALALGPTLRATLAAAAVAVLVSVVLAHTHGIEGVQIGYAIGHLVLAAGIFLGLRRAPEARAA